LGAAVPRPAAGRHGPACRPAFLPACGLSKAPPWPAGLVEAGKRLSFSTMQSLPICGIFEDIFPAESELLAVMDEITWNCRSWWRRAGGGRSAGLGAWWSLQAGRRRSKGRFTASIPTSQIGFRRAANLFLSADAAALHEENRRGWRLTKMPAGVRVH